jgi:branched-subunit amino acid ABC-type transport system permease component
MQLIINILITFSLTLLIAFSFQLIYQATKFFHITHAIIITLGSYFTYLFGIQLGLNLFIAILLTIICSTIIGWSINKLVYKPLVDRKTDPWKILIASLGLYIVFQNVISMIWGNNTKSIRTWEIVTGNEFLGAYITNSQIITVVTSVVLFLLTVIFLKRNRLGKQILAISSSVELSSIFGISIQKITSYTFIIGSALASISGILIALDTDMTPTMGFNILLYAVVAMIIGGIYSYRGLIFGSFLLAITQHLTAYYLDTKWMSTITFILLIAFLLWKPLGFSGKKLKKVEI